jgi:putative endonuclease
LERRVSQHNLGTFGGYTASRRPVVLVWQQDFQRLTDAIAAERQIKGWSRSKKEALIQGDFELLHLLSQQYAAHPELGIVRPSTRSPAARLLRMGPLELGRCEESTSS